MTKKRTAAPVERVKYGTPYIGNGPVERYNITLPVEVAEHLRAYGGGNLSAGIRAAAKRVRVTR